MDRKTYREAFDKLTFSPDFQARTQALLHQRAQALLHNTLRKVYNKSK